MATLIHCAANNQENRERSTREYQLAVTMYRNEGNTQGSLVAVERALQSDPNNADAHILLGTILGADERYQDAEPHLRRAVELLTPQAESDPALRVDLASAKNTWAAILVNLGRADDALQVLNGVIGNYHYPDQYLALSNQGLAYLRLQRYSEAVSALERSVNNRPQFCVGYYRLGEAYFHTGDYGRALEALNTALGATMAGCNRLQSAYRARGEVRARLHQPDAAQGDLERCRDLAPRSRDGQECTQQLRSLAASPVQPSAAPP